MKALYLLLALMLGPSVVNSQVRVSGTVKDAETLEPLPSANIRIVNSDVGTTSNFQGEFRLGVMSLPSTVIVSYVGYAKDSITIRTRDDSVVNFLLRKQPIQMDTVEVAAQSASAVALISKVHERLKEQERKQYVGKAFYRQYGKGDSTYTEVLEIFFELLMNNQGILEKAIDQGRYAMACRAVGDTTPLFSVSNLSDLTLKYFTLTQDKESVLSFLPFVRKTAVYRPIRPDADQFFFFRDDGSYQTDGRKVMLVSFLPKPGLDKPAFSGTMRIDLEDGSVLSIDETLDDPRVDLFPYEWRGYYQKDYVLNYKATYARSEKREYRLNSLETRLSFNEKHRMSSLYEKKWLFRSFMILYGYDDGSSFNPKGKPKENSDVANIKNVQLDPEFWTRHQNVLNEIPLEESIKQSFIARGFYGNLFPGGIKVTSR